MKGKMNIIRRNNFTGIYKNIKHSFSSNQLVKLELNSDNNKIGFLTLSNHKKRNALSKDVLLQLTEHLNQINKEYANSDGKKYNIIILTSDSDVFSAGHDLRELSSVKETDQKEIFDICGKLCIAINKSPSIFISEVYGVAAAAGAQLAAACDVTLASNLATFSTPGIKVGLFCTTPSVAISRAINTKRAMHMLLTADFIDAETAYNWGLVTRLISVNKGKDSFEQRAILREEVLQYANKISQFSSQTYSFGKQAFYKQIEKSRLEDSYEVAGKCMIDNLQFEDCEEGIKAFLEKRKPNFKH